MPKTAIIVLHYSNNFLTNQCVDSIQKTCDADIIVVDNCSPESYFRMDVQVIRTTENRNVKGMNFGFEYALKQNKYDYIVNFDNDIICLDNWLQPLIEAMENNPDVGIVGGKQWNQEKTQYHSVGADLMGMLYRNLPIDTRPVVWIQGSFHMYRVDMMRKIGIHDERYETICSDCDYCLHAIDRGWKVVFVHNSNVIHIGNASYKGIPVESEVDDKVNFTQKWLGMKFCTLLKTFNFDASMTHKILVAYQMDGKRLLYHISDLPARESMKVAEQYFERGNMVAVEVGSYLGNNAESMLKHLSKGSTLYLVDNDHDGAFSECKKRFANEPRVKLIEESSVEASRRFKDESLDFVYIDADHSFEAVDADIKAWLPKVKPNGILAGHDYNEPPERDKPTFNVLDAVDKHFGKDILHVGEPHLGCCDWWIYKKDLCLASV